MIAATVGRVVITELLALAAVVFGPSAVVLALAPLLTRPTLRRGGRHRSAAR